MSPEQGLVLFVALLLGLTALALIVRSLRAHRARRAGSSSDASEPVPSSLPSSQEIASLVGQDGFWVCLTCRSLNRREAKRCYACHAAVDSPSQPAPGALPVGRAVPVKAARVARSVGKTGETTVAVAAAAKAVPAPGVQVLDPGPGSLGAPAAAAPGLPVCPFLGFRDDPSTRCDFPDPRNLCHATSKRGARFFASPRRFVPRKAGTARSRPIAAEHQKSRCLSATHVQCARYPAVEVVAASR
jgi:hypothetical protein